MVLYRNTESKSIKGDQVLHITLGDRRTMKPGEDELNRAEVGFAADMSQDRLWEANRGCWVLGARADNERYVVYSHDGVVRMVARIDGIDATSSRRRVIVGEPLVQGDRAYDVYIDGPAPVTGNRNPITYFSDPRFDSRVCACGCGQQVTSGDWVAGHDQRALHERVGRLGSVKDFVEWFDAVAPESVGAATPAELAAELDVPQKQIRDYLRSEYGTLPHGTSRWVLTEDQATAVRRRFAYATA